MFCNKCRYEYRDGITVCPECGQPLSETPTALSNTKTAKKAFNPNEKPKILCIAADEFEADIIIAKLKSEEIYAFKKFKSSDSYGRIILGRTVLGVEIVVSESDYAQAKEIIGR